MTQDPPGWEEGRRIEAKLNAAATSVFVYGFERFLDIVGLDFRRDGLKVEFKGASALRFLPAHHAPVAILPLECPALKGRGGEWTCSADSHAATVQAIRLATAAGAAVCFILSSETPHPYPLRPWGAREYDQDTNLHLHRTLPGYFLLRALAGHAPKPLPYMVPALKGRRDEFKPFLDHFGAAAHELVSSGQSDVDVLALAGENQRVAVACELGRSFCLWLPTRLPEDADEWQDLVLAIGRSVLTYTSRKMGEQPDWASAYTFNGEQEIRIREADATKALEAIRPEQERFEQLRRIIWARDDHLHLAVVEYLRALGVDVEVDERYLEDFWIREGATRAVIGEVKAFNPNISPTSVASIVSYRSQWDLADSFPALFVARPFASEPRIVDRRVEPNVCRRAKADNVVIMRTLDLANVYNLIAEGKTTVADLLQETKSGGGWLKIDDQGMKKLVS